MFFRRNDARAETPVLWPPHVKSWLIGKDSDAGRDWGKEEKGTTEDEMVGWHHWLDGREFEWTPGDGGGQGVLACCDPWGRKESYTTERLNWTEFLTSRNITGQAHTPEFPCIPGQQSLHSSQQVQYKKTHSYSLIKQKHNSEYYDRGLMKPYQPTNSPKHNPRIIHCTSQRRVTDPPATAQTQIHRSIKPWQVTGPIPPTKGSFHNTVEP